MRYRSVSVGLALLAAVTLAARRSPANTGGIAITAQVPGDLPAGDSLPQAAAFAWNEFIALNWPAVQQAGQLGTRGAADDTATFGVPGDSRPLVWHTYRSKVEIFPPNGTFPNGYDTVSAGGMKTADSAHSYGYDALPRYRYRNPVSPASGPGTGRQAPWINLDETNEIGLDAMYAGAGTGSTSLRGLILFTAKANRAEYNYVAANRYFDSTTLAAANAASSGFVVRNRSSPAAGTAANGVSLPTGTIELKAAWRALTAAEAASNRFYTTRVRYYPTGSTYVDTTMGLVALHIIHNTPSRPYFVFATFEQADNLLSSGGGRVEDVNGNLNAGFDTLPPMDPGLTSRNARRPGSAGYTPANVQHLGPDSVTSTPGSRLYYVNTPGTGEPDGIISVNRRVHGIPPEIVQANVNAHTVMTQYATARGLPAAVWQYYKLVNVQYRPIDKPTPGVAYAGADSATYYQANIVVETDQNLQKFSGRFQPSYALGKSVVDSGGNRITDWCGGNAFPTHSLPRGTLPPGCARNGDSIQNVYAGGKAYNMGGCMGCHGNAQVQGGDFSFLAIGGPVEAPDSANAERAPLNTQKYSRLFGIRRAARAAARAGASRRP
jgi:hypothetical protein